MDPSDRITSYPYKEIVTLTRTLVKERINSIPFLQVLGNVDELSDIQLMGLPEATIITIIQTYYELTNKGISEQEALKIIESHRSYIGYDDNRQRFLGLRTYIEYRLDIEHSSGLGMDPKYIEKVMIAAVKIFA
jgi:hypothetical protein